MVRHGGRVVDVSREEHDGDAVLVGHLAQEQQQVGALLGLEVAGGLVGEQDGGAADQGAGQRGALALGGGQLAGALVAAVGEADALEQGVDRLRLGSAAGDQQRQGDVLAHRDRGQHGGGGEQEADALAPQARELEIVEPAQRAAVEAHGPAGGSVETGEQVQQRCLAGARGPDNGGQRARRRLERYVAEHVHARAGVADAVEEIVRNDSRHGGNCLTAEPNRKGRLAAPLGWAEHPNRGSDPLTV